MNGALCELGPNKTYLCDFNMNDAKDNVWMKSRAISGSSLAETLLASTANVSDLNLATHLDRGNTS